MFSFDLELLKMDFSNPMLWAGLVLMVVAVIGYFWMTSKQEETPKQHAHGTAVSFAPTAQVMEIPANGQQEQMYQEQPQQYHNLEDQPTVATCIVNEAGEQVCA
jgi:flagellar basal body-associated protein FliL